MGFFLGKAAGQTENHLDLCFASIGQAWGCGWAQSDVASPNVWAVFVFNAILINRCVCTYGDCLPTSLVFSPPNPYGEMLCLPKCEATSGHFPMIPEDGASHSGNWFVGINAAGSKTSEWVFFSGQRGVLQTWHSFTHRKNVQCVYSSIDISCPVCIIHGMPWCSVARVGG